MRIGLRGRMGLVGVALAATAGLLPLMAPQVRAQGAGTWTRQTAPAAGASDLQGVYFINATTGWAVGGTYDSTGQTVALWTTDGGSTWNLATVNGTKSKLYAVHFISAAVGYAVGANNSIFVSLDGGKTWAHNASEPKGAGEYRDLQFGDATHGCAVAQGGGIVCTADGGTTWTALTGNQAPACTGTEGISYGSASVAYVVGKCGVLKSVNADASTVGGVTFSKVSDPPGTSTTVDDISCADATHCTVIGDEINGTGTVANTIDGATFTPQTTCITGMGLEAANFVHGDPLNGWIGGIDDATQSEGQGHFCQTVNAGTNWTTSAATVNEVKDIWFVDSCHGWAVTESPVIVALARSGQPRVPAIEQLGIYAFTDTCPSPASSIAPSNIAPIGLPKSGGPASQGGADIGLLIAAATALALCGLGTAWLVRRD